MVAPADDASSAAAATAVSAGSESSLDAAADSARQVRSHPSHAGPDSAAASANGGDGAAEAEADHSPPAVARLHRHALESIFAFLDQRGLAVALQVSRGWLAAVKSMASLQLTVPWPSASLMRVTTESSVIGRHVTQIGNELGRVPLTVDSLAVVSRLMPQLCVLFVELDPTRTDGPLNFPPALQKLVLRIADPPAVADANAALVVVSRLALLESLAVFLPTFPDQLSLSLAPLASMPQLRHLHLHGWLGVAGLSDAQVNELRALTMPLQFLLGHIPIPMLRRLLAQPHQLQWQEMTLPYPMNDEMTALLTHLPSLTKIILARFEGSHFDWLQRLPNLTHVDVDTDRFSGGADVASLLAALPHCTNIEHLRLSGRGLLSAHLAELLPRLPRLHSLELETPSIDSLSFLALQPLRYQLTSVVLRSCALLELSPNLSFLGSLPRLKSLELQASFDTPLGHYRGFLPKVERLVVM